MYREEADMSKEAQSEGPVSKSLTPTDQTSAERQNFSF